MRIWMRLKLSDWGGCWWRRKMPGCALYNMIQEKRKGSSRLIRRDGESYVGSEEFNMGEFKLFRNN